MKKGATYQQSELFLIGLFIHIYTISVAKTENVGRQRHFVVVVVVFLKLRQKRQFTENNIHQIIHYFSIQPLLHLINKLLKMVQ